MKRGQKFLIGFAAAALTYGALFAAFGPGYCKSHLWKRDMSSSHHHAHCPHTDRAPSPELK